MNYFIPGLQEIERLLKRGRITLQLMRVRRQRDHALTELGLLGWQQADFDERTQQQVDEIQNVERSQSQLMNEAAQTATEIRRLTAERDQERRKFQETRRQLEQELKESVDKRTEIERQIAAIRKREPNFERRIPELDRELKDLNKLYSELLMLDKHTPKTRQELTRIRERIVSIPNEKSDLRTQHLRTASELRKLEEALQPAAEVVRGLEQRLKKVNAEWEIRESSLQAESKSREKEKAAAERHFNILESAKRNPYLRIGEVLSASNICPVNQPESLDRVQALQAKHAELEGAWSKLRAASDAAAGRETRSSLILCLAMGGAMLLLLLWLIFR